MAGRFPPGVERKRQEPIGYVSLSDEVRQIVDRYYPPADRQAVTDALASILSVDIRNTILVLAFGNTAHLLKLVELDHLDWRHLALLMEMPPGHRWDPNDDTSPCSIGPEEWHRRRAELGFPYCGDWVERQLESEVKEFVGRELLFPTDQLEPSTELQRDLGLGGADGKEFLRTFATRFSLDGSEFHPETHFPPKPEEQPLAALVRRMFGRPRPTAVPLTVAPRRESRPVGPLFDSLRSPRATPG
jgi:hypothetical protein